MPARRPYEFRDRAHRLLQMARETVDERARRALSDLAAENLAKADEAEAALMDPKQIAARSSD
jgi:hypothetical protein